MLLKVKGMSENMNSKLTADAWLDINITAGICGICKLFIALHKKKKKKIQLCQNICFGVITSFVPLVKGTVWLYMRYKKVKP